MASRSPGVETPDDEHLAAIVRDVADAWTMPPQRLGAVAWRDRIRRPRRRLLEFASGGLRGLGAAASLAVLATVVLSLAAVWLTLPRSPQIGTATGQPQPTATPAHGSVKRTPNPNPLPEYAVYGAPVAGRVLLNVAGAYQSLDLSNGRVTGDVANGTSYMSQLFARPGGGLVCSCVHWDASDDYAGTMTLDIQLVAADGHPGATIHVATFTADRDPVVSEEEGQGGTAIAGLSPDGETLYVAWGYRRTPMWHAGISVVDLVARRVVQTYKLPDRPSIVGSVNHALWLVALKVAPDGGHAMVTASLVPTTFATPRNLLTLESGRITAVETLPDDTDAIGEPCSNGTTAEDWATNATYFVVCATPDTVRRFAIDGHRLDETEVDPRSVSSEVGFGGADLIDRASGRLYHWNPASRTLTQFDLAAGKVTGQVTAATTAAAGGGTLDGLAGLGRRLGTWLAPVAAAKSFLDPSLAISPDGSRIYAIGTASPARTDPGSSGVDVFDTGSMTQVGHWEPMADLVSVGVSADGTYVYLAGAPDATADGSPTDAPASLIVADAASGAVRVVCGSIGSDLATIVR